MDPVLARFAARLEPELAERLAGQEGQVLQALRALCGDDADLAAALGARIEPGCDLLEGLAQIRVGDVRLVGAALRGDPASLQRIDSLLIAEVDTAASNLRAPAGLADEVKQRLRAHLLVGDGERGPALDDFAGRGDLRGFMRITAVRECLRVLRRERREIGMGADELAALAPAVDPELQQLKLTYRDEFTTCFVQALASLDARARTILRMNAIDRLSIDQIGAVYAVHRATAARWLERARASIAERTEQLLAERLALTTHEVASVIRLVRSELDVSLERLLR
jgi:RNA polymerase sigma-70 factor (ECF subfamily)